MRRTMFFGAMVLAGLAMESAAMAALTSELLEKGIYTEETVGDLNRAISIYETVVAEGKASHALAAQAQFHIGRCLLKQGKKAEATAAFEKLINDFADQKELVAKARQFAPEGNSARARAVGRWRDHAVAISVPQRYGYRDDYLYGPVGGTRWKKDLAGRVAAAYYRRQRQRCKWRGCRLEDVSAD